MSLSGDKGVAQFKKSVKMGHPNGQGHGHGQKDAQFTRRWTGYLGTKEWCRHRTCPHFPLYSSHCAPLQPLDGTPSGICYEWGVIISSKEFFDLHSLFVLLTFFPTKRWQWLVAVPGKNVSTEILHTKNSNQQMTIDRDNTDHILPSSCSKRLCCLGWWRVVDTVLGAPFLHFYY